MNHSDLIIFKQAIAFLHQDGDHVLGEDLVEQYLLHGLLEERDGRLRLTDLGRAKLATTRGVDYQFSSKSQQFQGELRTYHHRGFDIHIQLYELAGKFEVEYQVVDTDDLRVSSIGPQVHCVPGLHNFESALALAYVEAAKKVDNYLDR